MDLSEYNDTGMNALKEKEYLDAYNCFYRATNVCENEIVKYPENDELKQQYLNYCHMSATMLILEYKKMNDLNYIDKGIEILKKSVNTCLLYKVKYDIYFLITLLCDCYELKKDYKEIELYHISIINCIKNSYNHSHAIEYAQKYSSMYYTQSMAVTEENKDLVLYYSRISILLLIEIYKINQDKNIFAHFIDRDTLRSINFTEEEIEDMLKLFDNGNVTEITLNYNST